MIKIARRFGLAIVAALALAAGGAQAQQVLKVGSTPTGTPFTFLDTKTNSIQGIMVDIVNAIAAGVDRPRQEVVDFSRPIYTYGEGVVVPKKDTRDYVKLEEMKGYTIGVQKGTAFVEPLQKSGLFADVKIYDTIPAILADVNNGRIQAGFADKPIAAYNLQQGLFPETRLVKTYVSTIVGSVGIAVRKGDAELLKKINTSLEKLQKAGAIDKILAKWGQ